MGDPAKVEVEDRTMCLAVVSKCGCPWGACPKADEAKEAAEAQAVAPPLQCLTQVDLIHVG